MKSLFLAFILVCCFVSCSKSSTLVTFSNVEKTDVDCLIINSDTYVVNNRTELSELYLASGVMDNCNIFQLDYGWGSYTLLGQKIAINMACMINARHELASDDNNKEYIFTVKHSTIENCNEDYEEMYWILAPKLPNDYSVIFKVEQE